MNKNVVYIYNEIWFGNTKKLSTNTYHSVDEPWKCYVKQKPVRKDHILWFNLYECGKQANV